jgi:hypothetical protein
MMNDERGTMNGERRWAIRENGTKVIHNETRFENFVGEGDEKNDERVVRMKRWGSGKWAATRAREWQECTDLLLETETGKGKGGRKDRQ